jgi:hypothetical protein
VKPVLFHWLVEVSQISFASPSFDQVTGEIGFIFNHGVLDGLIFLMMT